MTCQKTFIRDLTRNLLQGFLKGDVYKTETGAVFNVETVQRDSLVNLKLIDWINQWNQIINN